MIKQANSDKRYIIGYIMNHRVKVFFILFINQFFITAQFDMVLAGTLIEEPVNVRQNLSAVNDRIMELSCPTDIQQYENEVRVLQKRRQEIKGALDSINKDLREIHGGMYKRLSDQQDSCNDTTEKSLSQVTEKASSVVVDSFLKRSDDLLACIDTAISKLDRRIDEAKSKGNSMLLMRLDQANGKLANIRSDTTALSQELSVHKNKRARLVEDAKETGNQCIKIIL